MSTNSLPKVTVVMPAYNMTTYLDDAITSVLNQTFTDFELLIIDDCSTDNTWERINFWANKDRRIIPLQNKKNSRASATRNHGIKMARAPYVAQMDSDDTSEPTRLEKEYAFLEAHPEVLVVGAAINVCDMQMHTTAQRIYKNSDTDIRKNLFRYSPFCNGATMIRTAALQEVGGYNIHMYDAEDYDMYFRLGKLGKFANLPQVLYNYRVNPKGVTITGGRRQEVSTLYVRIKAVNEYKYAMTKNDKVLFAAHLLSMYIIPFSLKYKLFNLLRNKRLG